MADNTCKDIHLNNNNSNNKNSPNSTSSFLPISARWENIPETLVINGIVFIVLYVTFRILTRIAWRQSSDLQNTEPHIKEEYTKYGLLHFLYYYRDPERWSLLPRLEFIGNNSAIHNHDLNWPYIYFPDCSSIYYPSILTDERLQATFIARRLNDFFSKFFSVTDADIIYSKGLDAYEYLLFQRHLILFLFILNLFCLFVLLPCHWFGGTNHLKNELLQFSFSRTTIKNLDARSSLYWFHIVCELFFTVLAIVILKSYRESTVAKQKTQLSRRTLLIGNIPKSQRSRAKLTQILRDGFPRSTLEAIQFVYKTDDLENEQLKLDCCTVARDYCIYYKRKYNRDYLVKSTDVNEQQACGGNLRLCSYCYVCCCYWPYEKKQVGTEYYGKVERELRAKICTTCEEMVKNPTEHAFVTFRSHKQARLLMEDLSRLKTDVANGKRRSDNNSNNNNNNNSSNNSNINNINNINDAASENALPWSVRFAPLPDNVEYPDLLIISGTTKARVVLLNIAMVVIFIFVTTPSVLLSLFDRYELFRPSSKSNDFYSIILNYVSVLLQVATTAILPALIVLISKSIPYEDSASKNYSIMWKVYMFLVLMIIVFPSIGMTSIQALLQSGVKTECMFPVDNGAYYINYVTSSTFISTVMELIKPTDILFYGFMLATSRSLADYECGRQYIARDFSISMQHTSVLLMIAVVLTYIISCPLICGFGLLYMIIKHAIDHYNLFYTYYTKKVDRNTQTAIEIFLKISILLMQFQTLMSITMNTGVGYFSLISQIIFWITLAIFVNNCFFDCTSKALINNAEHASKYHQEFCACFYLPRVFDDLLRADALPAQFFSKKV